MYLICNQLPLFKTYDIVTLGNQHVYINTSPTKRDTVKMEKSNNEREPIEPLKGYVSASKYRKNVMATLRGEPETVTEISKKTGIHTSHVSKTLKELREKNLVECINPDRRKGRLYTLTDPGEKVIEKISPSTGAPPLLIRFAEVLDELSIPYAKNSRLEAAGQRIVPDFIIQKDFEPKMIVEVKVLPDAIPKGLREYAFSANELKKAMDGLKTVLLVGGSSKKAIMRSEAGTFITGDHFDAVLHEDDLECMREKELGLNEFLEVEKHCMDWPPSEE